MRARVGQTVNDSSAVKPQCETIIKSQILDFITPYFPDSSETEENLPTPETDADMLRRVNSVYEHRPLPEPMDLIEDGDLSSGGERSEGGPITKKKSKKDKKAKKEKKKKKEKKARKKEKKAKKKK